MKITYNKLTKEQDRKLKRRLVEDQIDIEELDPQLNNYQIFKKNTKREVNYEKDK